MIDKSLKILLAILTLFIFGCKDESNVYTLYRSSIVDTDLRVHIASFNTDEKESYNKENCFLAASLFQDQPFVETKFWCEKGKYEK